MNGIDEGVINYALYEDGKRLLGVAKVTMPDKVSKTFTINGAGIGGDIELPVKAARNAMKIKIEFRNANESAYILEENRVHLVDLRVLHQNADYMHGELKETGHKFVLKIIPVSFSGGDIETAKAQPVSGEFSVLSLKEYIEEKLMRHIDPVNMIDVDHTGKDRAESIRRALGM